MWWSRKRAFKSVPDQRRYRSTAIKAFTMVEVIVALAILSTSMLAIFGVLRMCATANTTSQRLTESALLAERLMSELAVERDITYQTVKGQEGVYAWQIQTAPTGMDNLAAVCVRIQWLQQQRPQQYELLSLIQIPVSIQGQ
jgi:prepilin-type N-terminal cleavage/methylation domain-containing protein